MSLFDELKRRKVFRVGIAYVIGAWVIAQAADLVAESFLAPVWVMQVIITLLLVGLPIALILSWAFDLTRDGIVRARDDSSQPALSNTMTNSLVGGMVTVVAVVLYLIWPQPLPPVGNSIAVLPFAIGSAAEEDAEFFADGMHGELLAHLTGITALKVISRTSVMEYRNTTKNMRQIGDELRVRYLLEGNVQRAGNRLRIIIQLIDAAMDERVGPPLTYDRQLTADNILDIQADMAMSIASALQQTLSPELTVKLNERPTQNTRAYDFYLSGIAYLNRGQANTALDLFGKAVDEDPTFALAWAALSRAHTRMYWTRQNRIDGQHLKNAREAADNAFKLVPNLPEAHFAMGEFYMYVTRELEKSLEELAIAASNMPGSSDVQQIIADVQRRSGDFEASIATAARAIDLDPRNTRLLLDQATTYAAVYDATKFHQHVNRVLDIEPDSFIAQVLRLKFGLWLGDDHADLRAIVETTDRETGIAWFRSRWLLGIHEGDFVAVISFLDDMPEKVLGVDTRARFYATTYQLAGQPDLAEPYFKEAKDHLEQLLRSQNYPDEESRLLMDLAQVTAGLGDFDKARGIAENSMAMKSPDEHIVTKPLLSDAALGVFIPAGDYDRAIKLLDEHFTPPLGWTIEGLSSDPRLDPIRKNPGWLALVEKYQRP